MQRHTKDGQIEQVTQYKANRFVETGSDKTRIYISHGVDYGKWLELAHERRYAILQETVQNVSPEILNGFTRLLGHLR